VWYLKHEGGENKGSMPAASQRAIALKQIVFTSASLTNNNNKIVTPIAFYLKKVFYL
jgi:hypothetical protein